MCSLIDAADTKRRWLEVNGGAVQNREPSLRNLRYGLRGVGVGEASHPGPQHDRQVQVLDDLEMELGLIVMRTRWERHIHPGWNDPTVLVWHRWWSTISQDLILTVDIVQSHVGQDLSEHLVATWSRETGVSHVSSRSGHQETGAELDR